MLSVMAPAKMLLTVAVVSAGLVPCGLFALARQVFSGESDTITSECASASAASPFVAQSDGAMNEIGLQETLDRLGYTVNVPVVYGGHHLLRWNHYRQSIADDTLPADSFVIGPAARFTKVSEQGMVEGNLDFGVLDAQGRQSTILAPDHNPNTYWISAENGAACSWSAAKTARFYINDTSHMLHTGAFSSMAKSNADHVPHLLALPARTGGHWIQEGGDTGHWEGGKDTGATLLCWEDWQDYDYQDMIILAQDVVPQSSGEKAHYKSEIATIARQHKT